MTDGWVKVLGGSVCALLLAVAACGGSDSGPEPDCPAGDVRCDPDARRPGPEPDGGVDGGFDGGGDGGFDGGDDGGRDGGDDDRDGGDDDDDRDGGRDGGDDDDNSGPG